MLSILLNVLRGSPRRGADSLPRAAFAPSASSPVPASSLGALPHIAQGNSLLNRGRVDDAAQCYRNAIVAEPDCADAHLNLGYALAELARIEEAIPVLRRAAELAPSSCDVHYLLATSYSRLGDIGSSIKHFEHAVAWKPDFILAYRDLGKALCDCGQNAKAKEVLKRGLTIDATSADLYYFLGNVQAADMELDDAVASYERALDLQPDYASVHANLALVHLNRCEDEAALSEARKALALDPWMHHARSNLLVALSRSAECSPSEYLREARAYADAVGARAKASESSGAVHPRVSNDPRRPLRVGFVSGDLRSHPVGFFLENVMAHWNGTEMEPFAYSNHGSQDDLTRRLQTRFVAWRDISASSDEVVDHRIRADRIDVLVDLSGHTAHNRLTLFARRPAPVQATWLGYWASTGLPSIDYVVCDPVSVPLGDRDQFIESPWYLPDTRLCFSPPAEAVNLEVSELPASRAGHVTFGCFQSLTKINDAVLKLWARVIEAVPGACLRIQSMQFRTLAVRNQLLERLARAGIDSQRVHIAEPGNRWQYLASYAEVDIILDTFPHGGATTTCEALWMGVPTVTIVGSTLLERQGASLLGCAGLGDWVARNDDEYVALAVRHASNVGELGRLRRRLRRQVEASPLFDASQFAMHLQEALRGMWKASTGDGRAGSGQAQ